MSEERTVSDIAGDIAEKVFYHNSDAVRRLELHELLIEFAAEIERRAIEPSG